ncbi:hypothetical protein AB0C33_16310 [Nonomuraea sp. NPDC048881]|uniref:hypothetical protein n=1 Tax=Nonomuraea sp. NPDC048881 TaxID=3155030 RepID=UPI0033DFF2C3
MTLSDRCSPTGLKWRLVRQEDRLFNTRPSDDIEPDLGIVLGPPQSPAHAIIVEIQQDKSKDPRQLARYAAAQWLMLRCDVTVLVVCPDRGAAASYSQPIDTGLTGYRLQAYVLGPDDVPAITDPQEAAAHLELAVMSVMIHGRERKVIEAFASHLGGDHGVHRLAGPQPLRPPTLRQGPRSGPRRGQSRDRTENRAVSAGRAWDRGAGRRP